jgi:hypothetical protein
VVLLEPLPQRAVLPVDLVAGDAPERRPGIDGAPEHLPGQFRLRCKLHLIANAGSLWKEVPLGL